MGWGRGITGGEYVRQSYLELSPFVVCFLGLIIIMGKIHLGVAASGKWIVGNYEVASN